MQGVCVVAVWIVVAGCGQQEDPAQAPLPLDLPVVGTVGDLPGEDVRVTVQVTREGEIRVPGSDEALGLRDLRARLSKAAREGPGALRPDGSSLKVALLQLDADTPWRVAQFVMQTCAHPDVKINEIALAARTPDGERGALHITLPRDRSGPMPGFPEVAPTTRKIKLFMRTRDAQPSGLAMLQARLRAMPLPKDSTLVYEIVAPPPSGGKVPYQVAMGILEICLASGGEHIFIEGAAIPLGEIAWNDGATLAAEVRALRTDPGVCVLRIDNEPAILLPDEPGQSVDGGRGRISGRYGTSQDEFPMIELEEELEEVEEVGDR